MKHNLKALGKRVTKFTKLETFTTPKDIQRVTCTSDEVTALCPVTGQPDWYTVQIYYIPDCFCVESKTLKLYLQSFRNAGHFCEALAAIIAKDLFEALQPFKIVVTVTQKPRGGISIVAQSELNA